MRILKEDEGQVLVLTALSMVVLLGFAGLATDVGMLFHYKRSEQSIVDAAALAGAVDYKDNVSVAMAQTAAQTAATKNGLTDLSYLKVNIPPQSGPFAGAPGYVETIVKEPRRTFFMPLFGLDNVDVAARAVASIHGLPYQGCVTVLNKTASGAMTLQGSFTVDAPGCEIAIASNDSSALQLTGGAGSLTAGSVAVVGGIGGQAGDVSSNTLLSTNTQTPVNDPYGGLTGPTLSDCSGGTYSWTLNGTSGSTGVTQDTTTTTITGNTYTAPGDNTAVCFTQPVTLSNVSLGPGIYVFEQGLTMQGTVQTYHATLDIQSGGLTIPTGGVSFGTAVTDTNQNATDPQDGLVAPITGPTNGIALMEPPGNTNEIMLQKGNATGNITGAIYAPSAELFMQDSGGDKYGGISVWGNIIVDTFYDKTTYMTVHSYADVAPNTDPIRGVILVE